MSENNGKRSPKFALGQIVATPGALELLEKSAERPERFLQKHVSGDWGEVCTEDAALNDEAVINGDRILSAYITANGKRLWVITECDRSVTTLLRPDEY